MIPIEITGISKKFGQTQALQDISFSIEAGELFGLIGPDGAGKSTLFNVLVTLIQPDEGTAKIQGYDLITDYKKIRHIIGYLPGRFSLYGSLSCQENLEFFAKLYGESIKKNYKLIAPIWEQLRPFKNRKASALSGGMKQKLALCCALVHKPAILFLDEPTTGVDPVSRRELWDILTLLKEENITVLVSTSYMEEAMLCTRIGLLQFGKLLGSNTPKQIQNNYKGFIFAVYTDANYQLLQHLQDFKEVQDFYAAGQQLNVVLNDLSEEPLLHSYLETLPVKIKNIEQINPTIEDCFIQLMKIKKNE
ncbi:MAG: ABC transporter ATP-binding protein [Bacteroidales bacterium]|jgi:ABC-type multidrug transport system ATPase subunit|nr:ABC transporter ATP-binding protein [Bacteroidales bacterium]